jgi:hypothetical protein
MKRILSLSVLKRRAMDIDFSFSIYEMYTGHQWITSGILTTWEAEMGRLVWHTPGK